MKIKCSTYHKMQYGWLQFYRALVELPYVRECLALNKSPLVSGNDDVTNAPKERKPESGSTHSISKDQGVAGVISFMKTNEGDSDCQLSGLKTLLDMTSDQNEKFTDSAKRTVAEMMRKHIAIPDLQILACRLLAVLATKGLIL